MSLKSIYLVDLMKEHQLTSELLVYLALQR